MVGTLRYVDRNMKIHTQTQSYISSIIYCLFVTIYFPVQDSDVSAADPNDILKNMKVGHHTKSGNILTEVQISSSLHMALALLTFVFAQDMDDMDADLFAPKKKPSSAPAQLKLFGNEGPKKDSSTIESKAKPGGAGNSMQSVLAFIMSSLSASHYYPL